MMARLTFSPLRRWLLTSLILAAPLAVNAQTGALTDQTAGRVLPVADLIYQGDELASGTPHLVKQAAPELMVSTLTVIGAVAAGGVALRRRRHV